MTARRFSLEEVERAWKSAKAMWHEVRIAGGSGDIAWETTESELVAALNALPEEPDLLAEAVGLLRIVNEADMLREHAYEAEDDDGSVYEQLCAFLAKVNA